MSNHTVRYTEHDGSLTDSQKKQVEPMLAQGKTVSHIATSLELIREYVQAYSKELGYE